MKKRPTSVAYGRVPAGAAGEHEVLWRQPAPAAPEKVSLRREGGDWIIDGQKQWITSGAHAGV